MSEPEADQNSRYRKQMLVAGIGASGQQKLGSATVVQVGCGALGCASADLLARAGIGTLRLIDRDFVEFSNLQRQCLFTEADANQGLPKAEAAALRLRSVNSEIRIESCIADVAPGTVAALFQGADLIIDGTDNFETRFLLNDYSLQHGVPWIFAGVTGTHGQVMPVLPGVSGCLRCLMTEPPPPGIGETCDTAGILGSAVTMAAGLQAAAAIRLLTTSAPGNLSDPPDWLRMSVFDVWDFSMRSLRIGSLRSDDCPACSKGAREWLDGSRFSTSAVLCGRNAVQIRSSLAGKGAVANLEELEARLRPIAHVLRNPFLLKVRPFETSLELTIFPDGRAIVQGTEDPAEARSAYARYVGA